MNIEDRLRDALRPVANESPPHDLVNRSLAALPPRSAARSPVTSWLRFAAAGIVVLAVGGLLLTSLPAPSRNDGAVGATSPTPAGQPSTEATAVASVPTAAPEPTETAAPSPSQVASDGPAPTPVDPVSERERSEIFWGRVSNFAPYGHTYDSLADITAAAHLVVRGRIVDLELGQVHPFGADLPDDISAPYPEIFGVVEITEVLKGEPVSRTPGLIEVAGLGRSSMTIDDLPGGEFIIFLMNHAQQREERGLPPSADPDDRFHYERPNGYQCVLREIDGVIDIIDGPAGWEEAFGPFPSGLDGKPIDELAEDLRALVAVPLSEE